MMCLKENGEIMFHSAFKNDTQKAMLSSVEVKALTQIIIQFRAEEILGTLLSPNTLSKGMEYQLQKQLCSFENERPISS